MRSYLRRTRVRGAFVAGVAVALATVLAADPGAAQTTLRFNTWLPPNHNVQGGVMKKWAAALEAETAKRVQVQFTAASLGPPPRQFDLAKDGIADLVLGVHSYTPTRFRLTQMAEMPFLGDKGEAISAAYWRVHERHLAAADEHKGVKLLALWGHGPGMVANSVRPIAKGDDIKGLKLRVAGGLMVEIVSVLGGAPITAPAPQLYELLSRGVADGVLFTSEGITGFNLQRTVKFVTEVPGGLFNTSFFLAMNQAKWEALAKDDQAAIMRLSGEGLSKAAGRSYDELDRDAASRLRAEDIQVTTASPDFLKDLEAKLAPLEQAWIADARKQGVDGAAALQMFRAEVAKMR